MTSRFRLLSWVTNCLDPEAFDSSYLKNASDYTTNHFSYNLFSLSSPFRDSLGLMQATLFALR